MRKFMEHDFSVERIVLACFVPKGKGEPIHRNRPSHGLAFHTEGARLYDFGDRCVPVAAGEIIYLPQGSTYSVLTTKPACCYAMNFHISEQAVWDPFTVRVKNSRQILSLFQNAEQTWKEKQSGYTMVCKSLLYQVLVQLQTEYRLEYIQKSKLELIAPAVTKIHESYTHGQVSVEGLAASCGITPEYFRAIFQKHYGISPLKYINALKLTHGKELISSGLYSVAEAAELSGYSDPGYFSREFKKHFGVSPAVYKKQRMLTAGESRKL